MTKREASQSRTQQICELADEMGEFTMSDLAAYVRDEGVYAQIKLDSLMDQGVQADVKRVIKSQNDNDGIPIFVAISRGPSSLWKRWSRCTRVESRVALQIRAVTAHYSGRSLERLKQAHEQRFREDVTLPKMTRPRDWDEEHDTPPTHKWASDDPRR